MVEPHDIGKDFCVKGFALFGLEGLIMHIFHRIH